MPGRRSYQDPCGVARALDLVGERWALLVVRELLLGPKRFTDLRLGLPTASQNVLSQRLRDLDEAGLVDRRKLGPPASTWAYQLTERGRSLEPVLVQLARFGSRQPMSSTGGLSVDALILAMRTTFDPAEAGQLSVRIQLDLGDDQVDATVTEGRVEFARTAAGRAGGAATRIRASAATLRSVVFGGLALAEAEEAGTLRTEGDRRNAERFVALFPRPTPVG
jgi:DNA-binding HxlR family transcriptional regulator